MAHTLPAAARWLTMHRDLLPVTGRALDAACGRGRHALWLVAEGLTTLAVDRAPDAIARGGLTTNSRRTGGLVWPVAGPRAMYGCGPSAGRAAPPPADLGSCLPGLKNLVDGNMGGTLRSHPPQRHSKAITFSGSGSWKDLIRRNIARSASEADGTYSGRTE